MMFSKLKHLMLVAAAAAPCLSTVSPASAHVGGAIGDAELTVSPDQIVAVIGALGPLVEAQSERVCQRYRPMPTATSPGDVAGGDETNFALQPKMPSSQDLFLFALAGAAEGISASSDRAFAPLRETGGLWPIAQEMERLEDRFVLLIDALDYVTRGGTAALLTVTLPERSDPAFAPIESAWSKLHTHMEALCPA